MKIKALIAVRSGSERVANKNLRAFAGSNLLTVKINQLKRIQALDGIVVNSNDQVMLDIAESLGCTPVQRDPYYATSQVCMSDVYEHMAHNIDTDFILYANCTNPLIKDRTITDALATFRRNIGQYDSLNSAHLVKEFLFYNNLPINYSLTNQPRSQDLPDYFALNFAINIISRENMIRYKNVVGSTPFIYGINETEAIDIDNPIDFSFAEFVFGGGLAY